MARKERLSENMMHGEKKQNRKTFSKINFAFFLQWAGALLNIPVFHEISTRTQTRVVFGILDLDAESGWGILIGNHPLIFDPGLLCLLLLLTGTALIKLSNNINQRSMSYPLFLFAVYFSFMNIRFDGKDGLLWGLLAVVFLILTKNFWRPESMVPMSEKKAAQLQQQKSA